MSFRKSFQRTFSYKLDKNCTEQLKGIAIILVIFGHLSADNIIHAPFLSHSGSQGVTLFLFLSGYGLTKSYIKKGIDNSVLLKRFTRVLLPYSIITALWILIDVFLYHKVYSKKTMFLAIMGFDFNRSIDASMWYISFILLWYIFFNVIFRIPIKDAFKLILLLFVAYLFKYHPLMRYTHEVSYQWGLSAFTFPAGVIAGLYMDSMNKKLNLKQINLAYFCMFLTCLFVYISSLRYINTATYVFTISNFAFAFIVTIIILFINSMGYFSKLLNFIGYISYELYLLEAALMWKYLFIRRLQSYNVWLFLVVYFFAVITLSYMLNKLMAIIMQPSTANTNSSEKSVHTLS
jgi:peptidoglycan/LPS O-acetylase OafA/YrhL